MVATIDPLERALAESIVAATTGASGLSVRVGIADGKFAAYVAATLGTVGAAAGWEATGGRDVADRTARTPCGIAGPGAVCIVPVGQGAAFLASLSIEDVPVSVEMRRRLRLFGLRTLGELTRLPQSAVATQFGAEGARAWELAHGIDRSPIAPYRPTPTVTERLAFATPVDAEDTLLAAARTLLARARQRPEVRGRAARGLQLRVALEDGHTWERGVTFREPVGSQERMYLALRHRIEGATLPAPFTAVELALLGLCGESSQQASLFAVERGRQGQQVVEAARQLKARYGRPILAQVLEVEPWSRLPERRFALIDYDP